MNDELVLQMKNVTKSFPGVLAVDNMDFYVKKGTVHALMGENGAGKSTLMKVLAGLYPKDSGEIVFQGNALETSSVNKVLRQGISMIYQELSPVNSLTVAENIFCGKEPSYGNTNFFLNSRKMIKDASALLEELQIHSFSVRQKVAELSMGQKQLLEIVKAVANNSSLLIMDEPTSAITENECRLLFDIVRNLRSKGISFVFITHKIAEVFRIADEITVMRDGRLVGTGRIEEFTYDRVVAMMVGRELKELFPKETTHIGEDFLEVLKLSSPGKFENISFSVKRGEILGFYGLMGSGRTEVMETLWGYRKKSAGEIRLNGKAVKINRPRDAIRLRMAFLTEDRHGCGCFLSLDILRNIMMLTWLKYGKRFLIRPQLCKRAALEQIELHKIKASGPGQVMRDLSGGNQQKALIARWLLTEPDVLILDEPTRGIDVGSKYEIYREMVNLANEGKAIIMVSSDLLEVIGMSDRMVIMHEGAISGILKRSEFSQETILYYASGLVPGNC